MTTAVSIATTPGILKRVGAYKASKTVVFGACTACIAATIAVGFTWGGWLTSSSARTMGDRAASGAEAKLAAAICVDRFLTGPDARTQTARTHENAKRPACRLPRAGRVAHPAWTERPGRRRRGSVRAADREYHALG